MALDCQRPAASDAPVLGTKAGRCHMSTLQLSTFKLSEVAISITTFHLCKNFSLKKKLYVHQYMDMRYMLCSCSQRYPGAMSYTQMLELKPGPIGEQYGL